MVKFCRDFLLISYRNILKSTIVLTNDHSITSYKTSVEGLHPPNTPQLLGLSMCNLKKRGVCLLRIKDEMKVERMQRKEV